MTSMRLPQHGQWPGCTRARQAPSWLLLVVKLYALMPSSFTRWGRRWAPDCRRRIDRSAGCGGTPSAACAIRKLRTNPCGWTVMVFQRSGPSALQSFEAERDGAVVGGPAAGSRWRRGACTATHNAALARAQRTALWRKQRTRSAQRREESGEGPALSASAAWRPKNLRSPAACARSQGTGNLN